MYSENKEGRDLKKRPIITAKEAEFITESGQPPVFVFGMLSRIRRTGKTLPEIFNEAISEPGIEEHIPSVQKARDFLAENSEKFGLIIPPGESIR